MSFNFVQSVSGNTGTGTVATLAALSTMTITNNANDTLISVFGFTTGKTAPQVVTAITDSKGNIWQSLGGSQLGVMFGWMATNVPGGTTTITASGTPSTAAKGAWLLSEYAASGGAVTLNLGSTVSAFGTGTSLTGFSINDTIIGTLSNVTMLLYTINTATASIPWTATSPATVRGTATQSTTLSMMMADTTSTLAVTSIAVQGTGTVTTGTMVNYPFGVVTVTLPGVNVSQWNGTAVATPNIGGVPVVDVVDWLGTAVTSSGGVPITVNTGTVTATILGTPNVNVVDWDGIAVTTQGGFPLVDVNLPTVLGANVLEWNGAVLPIHNTSGMPYVDVQAWLSTAVTSAAGVPVTTNLGTVTATVPGGVTVSGTVTATVPGLVSANVTEWLGTAVTSNAGVPLVDISGTVTATVPGTIDANVTEWLGTAVTSNAGVPLVDVSGTVTATVPGGVTVTGGTITTVTGPVTIAAGQLTIKRATALAGFSFPMYNATTGNLQTGLTVSAQISIDGGALTSTTNAVAEIGGGLYSLNLSTSDTNGTVLTLIFSATGAAASVITSVTQA